MKIKTEIVIEDYSFWKGLREVNFTNFKSRCKLKRDFQNISSKSYNECEGLMNCFRDGKVEYRFFSLGSNFISAVFPLTLPFNNFTQSV